MIGFGVAAAWVAVRLDRIGPPWFVFGAILGPFALLLLRAAPPGLCRACGSPTRGWLKACWWCRQDVRTGASISPAVIAGQAVPMPAIQALPRRDHARPARQERPYQMRTGDLPSAPPATPFRPSEPVIRAPTTAASPAPIAPAKPPSPALTGRIELGSARVLATAVYVTGNTTLESGHRYGIAIRDSRLQILGPTDIDPSQVALDRPIAGVDARSVEGRLILGNPNGLVLAFMAVAGPATQDLAALIVEAARGKVD